MIDAQCSIPVFEGLFPDPHNTQVLRLLFLLAIGMDWPNYVCTQMKRLLFLRR